MKKSKHLSILIISILIVMGCKKDKLTGDKNVLIGSWASISTVLGCGIVIGEPDNPDFKLELTEKCKYKLCHEDKKIETGRLLLVNGLVTFKCSEKDSKLNGLKILKFNSDTLNIDRNACDDDYQFSFVKH
jgi:hypothetical protein